MAQRRGGATIGKEGSESGKILLDEEHPDGARISLERDTRVAPFAITCGIYGWFFHTRYVGDQAEANGEYRAMKLALEQILDGMSGPGSAEEIRQRVFLQLEDFIERFPT